MPSALGIHILKTVMQKMFEFMSLVIVLGIHRPVTEPKRCCFFFLYIQIGTF